MVLVEQGDTGILVVNEIKDAHEGLKSIAITVHQNGMSVAADSSRAPEVLLAIVGGEKTGRVRVGIGNSIRSGLAPGRKFRGRLVVLPVDLPDHALGQQLIRTVGIDIAEGHVFGSSEKFVKIRALGGMPDADPFGAPRAARGAVDRGGAAGGGPRPGVAVGARRPGPRRHRAGGGAGLA